MLYATLRFSIKVILIQFNSDLLNSTHFYVFLRFLIYLTVLVNVYLENGHFILMAFNVFKCFIYKITKASQQSFIHAEKKIGAIIGETGWWSLTLLLTSLGLFLVACKSCKDCSYTWRGLNFCSVLAIVFWLIETN